jgi:hypothetical protein
MKALLITSLFAVAAPAADASDLSELFKAHANVHKAIVKAHVDVARAILTPRVVVRHTPADRRIRERVVTRRVWVPVRYEVVRRKVFVPGSVRRVWHPAQYRIRYDACGRPYRVLVRAAHWDEIRENGHYEWREERVRRGGYYETINETPRHRDRHR